MTELSIKDKTEIFDITRIDKDNIYGKNRRIMVFEYFSDFSTSLLYEVIRDKNLDFQVKIVKEKYDEVQNSLLEQEYFDFQPVIDKQDSKYNINIYDGEWDEQIWFKKIEEKDLDKFVIDDYIYRHYLVINREQLNSNESSEENIDFIVYQFLISIRNADILLRPVINEDLESYIFNDINFPNKYWDDPVILEKKENINWSLLNEYDEWIVKKSIFLFGSLWSFVWRYVDGFVATVEKLFYHVDIKWITSNVAMIFASKMIKWDNYLSVWGNYKWGVLIKWLPKDNFNVLKYLFLFLERWDSIVINLYPFKKHEIEDTRVLTWLEKVYGSEKKKEEPDMSYLQMIVNFNDLSLFLLNKRIHNFQLSIWGDFYTQRVWERMSSYIETVISVGDNKLNNERLFDNSRLKSNIIF